MVDAPRPEVLVGTSGYSFPDWKGPFYPPGTRNTDMLPHYATRFSVVEVNTTYYRMPDTKLLGRMVDRTPDGFRFIVKAYRGMTHDPAEWKSGAICDPFVDALQPMREAGRFSGVLLQFPWRFRNTPRSRRHLADLRRRLPEIPLFVEFRREEWAREAVYRFMEDHRLGWCSADEPNLPGLLPPVHQVTNGTGYVRLHGRNRDAWWGRSGKDRYDYLYSDKELTDWAKKIRHAAGQADRTFVFFNNCYAGQAAENARVMQELVSTG
ncbi:MAG: DUF72 domain-containing protein [Gemmatimonadota bacterium]|jgi:uncharacterized protein YecE (DUF72 family)|nr:DUF72 domain-containing protein [Gemmatimonadota bacterium]MDP7030733.1 DUF72 domain-containing protein [Gemmatimonadota bacterium]